jgi:hypothetical protein
VDTILVKRPPTRRAPLEAILKDEILRMYQEVDGSFAGLSLGPNTNGLGLT